MDKIFAIKYSAEKRETVEPPLPFTDCEGAFDPVDRMKLLQISGEGNIQGGSNMTGTDLYVNKPHCAAAVRP
jgi:hypothetical protein